ncbi:hypothetical protein K0M31_009565 [Melipona bicolor]|uniref:Uncharacterized protein n=1 Tax=Melipona bicolor TaxID=60889 RepID=A0AA40KJ50_9HYME|nr:hypothetical protein K0M31_009565 [Melipona bicolor]
MHSDVCTRIVISGYQPLNSDDHSSVYWQRNYDPRSSRDCSAGSTFGHRNEIPREIDKRKKQRKENFLLKGTRKPPSFVTNEAKVKKNDGIAALADITGTRNYPPLELTREDEVLSEVFQWRVAKLKFYTVHAKL